MIDLDYPRAQVKINGTKILGLTRLEMRIIDVMKKADGRVLSREDLLKKAWDYDKQQASGLSTRAVDAHISRLRTKLRTALRGQDNFEIIATVPQRGYKLNI